MKLRLMMGWCALAAVLEEAPQAESTPATAQIPETARN